MPTPYSDRLLAVAVAVLPVAWAWHIELAATTETFRVTYTNGLVDVSGLLVYHALMYATFTACWATALRLLD